MAAQPLVSESYCNPLYTYETNVFGTINLLEAVRNINKKCTIIVITTDKVYDNCEIEYAYKETDKLGGLDPYSSSKACCELIINSWRNSFYQKNTNIKIATARAGNVIGGGDWAKNRIIPDLIRSIQDNKTLIIRNPYSTRPWQHVLEPLSGYLMLAHKLHSSDEIIFQSSFNFGPNEKSNKTVVELIDECFIHWNGNYLIKDNENKFYESNLLQVSIEKSKTILNWTPKWNFQECIKNTIEWYKKFNKLEDITKVTLEQIRIFNQI
jgi:CDP-glucose 4,6-dehydratase